MPGIWIRYNWDTDTEIYGAICLRFAKEFTEICLRYDREKPEICWICAWDMPLSCSRYTCYMPKTSLYLPEIWLTNAWDILDIYQGFTFDFPGFVWPMTYAWDMSNEICRWYFSEIYVRKSWDMPDIGLTFSRDFPQFFLR